MTAPYDPTLCAELKRVTEQLEAACAEVIAIRRDACEWQTAAIAERDALRTKVEEQTALLNRASPMLSGTIDAFRAVGVEAPNGCTAAEDIRALGAERDVLRAEVARLRVNESVALKHPYAPERCPSCEWTNTRLMNYGEPERSRWLCHGCAANLIAERDALRADNERMRAVAERIADAASHCRQCRECGDGPCCSRCDVEAACAALDVDHEAVAALRAKLEVDKP